MKKGGQAWGFDVMISAAVFVTALVIFYIFAINYNVHDETKFDQIKKEAVDVASTLMSEGLPAEWNQANVVFIGLQTDNQLNQTKLDNLYSLAQSDYNNTRRLLNTRYEYLVNFSEPVSINGQPIVSIGLQPSSPRNIFRVTRLTTYNDKPLTLQVIVWE